MGGGPRGADAGADAQAGMTPPVEGERAPGEVDLDPRRHRVHGYVPRPNVANRPVGPQWQLDLVPGWAAVLPEERSPYPKDGAVAVHVAQTERGQRASARPTESDSWPGDESGEGEATATKSAALAGGAGRGRIGAGEERGRLLPRLGRRPPLAGLWAEM